MHPQGRKLTLLFATLAVVVLGVAGWIGWPWLQFWWRFEALGLNEQGFPEYRHRASGIIMVRLPGGTFWMGAKGGEWEEVGDQITQWETPRHEVSIGPFLIGKHEVSKEAWTVVMGETNVTEVDWSGPAVEVSWDDCQRFCEQAGLSLPTEAEWEYACRGSTESPFAFGTLLKWEKLPDGQIVMRDATEANAYGLFNMHGNAFEWCQDFFDEHFYSKPESRAPNPVCTRGVAVPGLSDGTEHVIRGGFWGHGDYRSRSAARLGSSTEREHGIRVVFRLW